MMMLLRVLVPAVLFAGVVALSAVRVEPLHADCEGPNDMVLSNDYESTGEFGDFAFNLQVESWTLTFEPNQVWIDLRPNETEGIDEGTLNWEPSSVQILDLECEVSDPDIDPFYITGFTDDPCPTGGANLSFQVHIYDGIDSHDEYPGITIDCP